VITSARGIKVSMVSVAYGILLVKRDAKLDPFTFIINTMIMANDVTNHNKEIMTVLTFAITSKGYPMYSPVAANNEIMENVKHANANRFVKTARMKERLRSCLYNVSSFEPYNLTYFI